MVQRFVSENGPAAFFCMSLRALAFSEEIVVSPPIPTGAIVLSARDQMASQVECVPQWKHLLGWLPDFRRPRLPLQHLDLDHFHCECVGLFEAECLQFQTVGLRPQVDQHLQPVSEHAQ